MLDQVRPATRLGRQLSGLPDRHGVHEEPRRREVPADSVSGNHYTGRPVDVVVDDIESYRWPTAAVTARLEAVTQPRSPRTNTTTSIRPGGTMMSEPVTRSGISTASVVFAAVAFALTLIAYAYASAFALVFGLLFSVAGLTLGIVAKPRREAAITVSAIALLFGLAIGFGVMTY
jgi:hypothetical protein